MTHSSFQDSYRDKGAAVLTYLSSNSTTAVLLPNNVLTKVPLGSGDATNFNWTINYSDGSWTCPESGLWGFRLLSGMSDDPGVSAQRTIKMYVNGRFYLTVYHSASHRLGDWLNSNIIPLFLNQEDVLDVYINQLSGSDRTLASGELVLTGYRLI